MTGSAQQIRGTRYVVRQQLFTVHQDFEVADEAGTVVMSGHGNGLRVMDRIQLSDERGSPVLEVRQRPGARPKAEIISKGRTLLTIGERRVGVRDHFVIDTPLPATFDIVGNAWSTNYAITINGDTAAQIAMEPGLAKADTYHVVIGEGRKPRILVGIILAVDILTHQGKR